MIGEKWTKPHSQAYDVCVNESPKRREKGAENSLLENFPNWWKTLNYTSRNQLKETHDIVCWKRKPGEQQEK